MPEAREANQKSRDQMESNRPKSKVSLHPHNVTAAADDNVLTELIHSGQDRTGSKLAAVMVQVGGMRERKMMRYELQTPRLGNHRALKWYIILYRLNGLLSPFI